MMLTTTELEWIDERMDWYKIKYQEIYDEIADHIITGIEAARVEGDLRTIDVVFQTVVDNHFDGYAGIEEIVQMYEKAYRDKIEKMMFANYKYYINRQSVLLLFALMVIGFYLPHNKLTSIALMCCLFIITIIPIVYVYTHSFKIKTSKGKKSIVKGYVLKRAYLLIMYLNIFVCIINSLRLEWQINFLREEWQGNFIFYLCQEFIFMVLFFVFIVYGLSIVKICKHEFKIAG